jgi:hypothetical protein
MPWQLRAGCTLLALASLGLLSAPLTILSFGPDLTTRAGRHVLAGALGLSALALLLLVVALVPLRRGERWALWVAAAPFVVVGVPMLVVDASFVAPGRVLGTLAPQLAGNGVGVAALVLCAVGIRRRSATRRG